MTVRVTCACCGALDPTHEAYCPFPGVDALGAGDLEAAAVDAVRDLGAARGVHRPWWIAVCRAEAIGGRMLLIRDAIEHAVADEKREAAQ